MHVRHRQPPAWDDQTSLRSLLGSFAAILDRKKISLRAAMTVQLAEHDKTSWSVSAWPPFTAASNSPTDLRTAVNNAIAPWRYRDETPPPFTSSELVVMALVLRNEPMNRKEMFLWIYNTFAYFKTHSPARLWAILTRRESHELAESFPWQRGVGGSLLDTMYCVPDLYDAVLSYDVPIDILGDKFTDVSTWTVDLHGARCFLQPRLWPHDPKGVFPFLRLPAEIRTCIYEMVFRYPPAGLQIDLPNRRCVSKHMVYARARDFGSNFKSHLERRRRRCPNTPLPVWCFGHGGGSLLEVGKLSAILALTHVSRQVHEETRGMFYAINTFCFDRAGDLCHVLQRMPARDRDCLQRIAFDYRCDAMAVATITKTFSLVATMKSLRWLHISLVQGEWLGYKWPARRVLGHPEIEDKLQFKRTARIGDHINVVLQGDYPEDTMKQIRSDPIIEATPALEEQDGVPEFSEECTTKARGRTSWSRMKSGWKAFVRR